MIKSSVSIVRGNLWKCGLRLSLKTDPGFDWSGLVATLRFRKHRTQLLSPPPLLTLSPSVEALSGCARLTFALTPADSNGLPEACVADLLVSRADPAFGPKTVAQYDITFTPTT